MFSIYILTDRRARCDAFKLLELSAVFTGCSFAPAMVRRVHFSFVPTKGKNGIQPRYVNKGEHEARTGSSNDPAGRPCQPC